MACLRGDENPVVRTRCTMETANEGKREGELQQPNEHPKSWASRRGEMAGAREHQTTAFDNENAISFYC